MVGRPIYVPALHYKLCRGPTGLAAAPVRSSRTPTQTGIDEEILRGHWIKLLTVRTGSEQS